MISLDRLIEDYKCASQKIKIEHDVLYKEGRCGSPLAYEYVKDEWQKYPLTRNEIGRQNLNPASTIAAMVNHPWTTFWVLVAYGTHKQKFEKDQESIF